MFLPEPWSDILSDAIKAKGMTFVRWGWKQSCYHTYNPLGNDWNDWSNQQIVHISTAGECLESVKFTKWCDFNVAVDNLAIMLGACATMPIENGPETKMANLAGFQNFIFIPIWQAQQIWVQYENFQYANIKFLLKTAWKSFELGLLPIPTWNSQLAWKRTFFSDIFPKKEETIWKELLNFFFSSLQ